MLEIDHFLKQKPVIGNRVLIMPHTFINGAVTLGDDCSIWPMVVVRGDMEKIIIGNKTNIQDGAVIHTTHDSPYINGSSPVSIGNCVTIGHKAIIHGAIIHDLCLIGMNATILDHAVIGENTIIGANSLVPSNKFLEPGFLWLGSPVKKIRPLTKDEFEFLKYSAENYVRLKDSYLAKNNLL